MALPRLEDTVNNAAAQLIHTPAFSAAGVSAAALLQAQTRLHAVQERIAAAATRAGRSAEAITLVAVSKTVDVAQISALHAAGQRDFGENRAQELRSKYTALSHAVSADDSTETGLRWHFVGRLQRNKIKDVVGTATLIHSVDRWELAESIAALATREGLVQRVLVQVNQAGDPNKAGCAPADAQAFVQRLTQLPGIVCEGLMAVPALGEDPRPVFRGLRRLRDQLRERFPEVQQLSMGMSGDYETAVEEGATIVRVGTALFGPRDGVSPPPTPGDAAATG